MSFYICEAIKVMHDVNNMGPGQSIVVEQHEVLERFYFSRTKDCPEAIPKMKPLGISLAGAPPGNLWFMELERSPTVVLRQGMLVYVQGSSLLAVTDDYIEVKASYG